MLPAIEQGITTVQAKMAESPWAVFTFLVLGGFMPIPMKVFTWASGIVGVPMPQYLLSMLIGRGKRGYVLAAVIRIGGARAEAALRRWIEPLGWIATALVVVLIAWLVWRRAGVAGFHPGRLWHRDCGPPRWRRQQRGRDHAKDLGAQAGADRGRAKG
ncbi:hypothetical protein G6F60_014018 [Rhizopus arrhizus]|nr:hypothetical protein G6F60_014018 [Rhizopus arrhizus]